MTHSMVSCTYLARLHQKSNLLSRAFSNAVSVFYLASQTHTELPRLGLVIAVVG